MFNLQGSELIIILLLALVVLGPEKLPDAMRKAGKAYADLRKMSSGFQEEFRAAVDEPLREIRDTANVLRDSADFTSLQDGEREEKPKSAEMAGGDPDLEPTSDVPTFEAAAEGADGPEVAAESRPAPFSGVSSTAPRPRSELPDRPTVTAPPPLTGMSAPTPEAGDDVATDADAAPLRPTDEPTAAAPSAPSGASEPSPWAPPVTNTADGDTDAPAPTPTSLPAPTGRPVDPTS